MNSPNSLELLNMDSATRKKLKSEIEVYLTKFSNAQIRNIREFPKSGTTFKQWGNLKKSTRNSLRARNIKVIFFWILCKG